MQQLGHERFAGRGYVTTHDASSREQRLVGIIEVPVSRLGEHWRARGRLPAGFLAVLSRWVSWQVKTGFLMIASRFATIASSLAIGEGAHTIYYTKRQSRSILNDRYTLWLSGQAPRGA
ncbi:hypothetical protein, partial [Xanthomonas axonopodis]|uniref:hypothetical protein n=1 Tax=Xanthomonas axonopodis TaxID=53413 RepID=UPI001C27DC22